MKDLRPWLGFSLTRGIGPIRLRALQAHFGDLQTAWQAAPQDLRAAGLSQRWIENLLTVRRQIDLEALLARYQAQGIRLLTWEDEAYPQRLKKLDAAPPLLFVRGTLTADDFWAVAIVGTRRVTAYGRQVTEALGRSLAQRGVTVVSGLARGVDTVAHRAALAAGGRTLAVLGCGVDVIYPPENRALAEEIMAHGALISDYPPGTQPEAANFPPRNRIIAGLSQAVAVVEAGATSGALITAEFAAEQGRDVFAVPGTIYAPQSKGTNRLIQQGAQPLLSPQDIFNALDMENALLQREARQIVPADPLEAQILAVLQNEPLHIDEIGQRIDLPMAQISAALTMMELKGMVKQIGAMRYIAANTS